MNDLDKAFIETALKDMVSKGYFSICTIDAILKVTKSIPDGEIYKRLHLMHCVHFNKMPQAVLNALPDMIRDVLSGQELNFDDFYRNTKPSPGQLIDITPEKKTGILRLFKP